MNMEIVSIEKKTFEMMMAAFGALSEKVAALRRKSDTGRMERWLTGEEVCGQLRISPRTLQTLRDRRLIGYSQINRRFYYKPEEVKRLIPLVGTLYPDVYKRQDISFLLRFFCRTIRSLPTSVPALSVNRLLGRRIADTRLA